jgi:hypothetical protein
MNVPINKVKTNIRNPRLIKDDKFKKLVKSIEEFPQMLEKRPIVCYTDEEGDYVVLGGNMRLKAAKEAGLKEVPISLADDWTQEQKDEFLIKDNVNFGEWDWDALANEWDADNLSIWGIDVPYLDPIVDENDFEKRFNNITDDNCLYPIVPIFDEDQELFIIVCENEIDGNWLRERLNMQKMKSYKYGEISKSNVIHISDLKDVL